MTENARDWLFTGTFLGLVGLLVVVGWIRRDEYTGVASGTEAPEFVAQRLEDGTPVSLAHYRGKVVLLNIWATWCAPCRREMPSMQRVYEELRDRGLEIVAVSTDVSPGELNERGEREGIVQDFVDDYGLTFPILLDPRGGIERQYGVVGLPTTILIDREGRIVRKVVGGVLWDEEPYRGMIMEALDE